ncbi:heterokaryon incompatibility protein-domain-containing protein [Phaeosphaeriaceae sp. PMI808]|nr:heterokaryon incompatibility protein-domain-containing protein [Phaeosphaeriaceae sp. PMI808]
MEANPLHTSFHHEPLPDSASHIRLLEILEGDFDHELVCQLTTWPRDNAPLYYALSYTWGDETPLVSISINGKRMRVRENCAYVLRQAFALKIGKRFWIDAICIDQASTQEKNHQVAMMGLLYENAEHVLACVGPHADDSQFLFETIDKERSLIASIRAHLANPGERGAGDWSLVNPIPESSRWLALRCFFAMKVSTRMRLANAHISFMQRPYFSRVWVLQELYLASKISCHCGMDSRPFDDLLAVNLLIDFWIDEENYAFYWRSITRYFVSLLSRQPWILRRQKSCKAKRPTWISIQPQRGCLALASGAQGPRRLSEVLDAMQHFHCADVRDKLYGVLSLVDWIGTSIPTPDYNKDPFQVAIEVLGRYLREKNCAPVYGEDIEWAGRLCEVFNISLKQMALYEAIRVRCLPSDIPGTISALRSGSEIDNINRNTPQLVPLSISTDIRHQKRIEKRSYGSSVSALSLMGRRERKSRLKDTWYGIRLHAENDVVQDFPSRGSKYLCYIPPVAEDSLGTIVDQHGSFVACVSGNTQANDWLLKSQDDSVTKQEPVALIIRPSSTSKYTIVSQAFIQPANANQIFRFLRFTQFKPHWNAEDLLLLEWCCINRIQFSQSSESRQIMSDWLKIRICGDEESSYFISSAPPQRLSDSDSDEDFIYVSDSPGNN